MLMLEGFQAGLSWSTILNKEETFRAAFDNWDAAKISKVPHAHVSRFTEWKYMITRS